MTRGFICDSKWSREVILPLFLALVKLSRSAGPLLGPQDEKDGFTDAGPMKGHKDVEGTGASVQERLRELALLSLEQRRLEVRLSMHMIPDEGD